MAAATRGKKPCLVVLPTLAELPELPEEGDTWQRHVRAPLAAAIEGLLSAARPRAVHAVAVAGACLAAAPRPTAMCYVQFEGKSKSLCDALQLQSEPLLSHAAEEAAIYGSAEGTAALAAHAGMLNDEAITPVAAWHVWQSRYAALTAPLRAEWNARLCFASSSAPADAESAEAISLPWASAPRAVWQLMREHRRRMGGIVPVTARFVVGELPAACEGKGDKGGKGGKEEKGKAKKNSRDVAVVYTMPADGACVHVEVHGLPYATEVHVGVIAGLGLGSAGEEGKAVARWRRTPMPVDAEVDLFAEARAIAQAEVARMELACRCPAAVPDVALAAMMVNKRVQCACAGGLAAAATRHAKHSTACPLTGAAGGLVESWWTWRPSSEGGADIDQDVTTICAREAAEFWVTTHGVGWASCRAREHAWRAASTGLGRTLGVLPALLPHVRSSVTKTVPPPEEEAKTMWACTCCGQVRRAEPAALTADEAFALFRRSIKRRSTAATAAVEKAKAKAKEEEARVGSGHNQSTVAAKTQTRRR